MVREILKIRTDNGLNNNNPTFHDVELTDYNAKFTRMGFPQLTATLMWSAPLDDEWTGREYVVLRGEKFYIKDTPHAEKTNNLLPWKHEIEFTSEFARVLGDTYFEDAVPSYAKTYDRPCSNSTRFTFYGTISEFVDRLNCSFLKAGIGDSILNTKTHLSSLDTVVGDGYCAMLDPYGADSTYDADATYEFIWEDKYLWDAITEGYKITDVPFERRGRKIIFGAVPTVIDHKFEYGHDNELLSIKHRNAKARVINRITMQGSSENIPYFYPNETEYGHVYLSTDTDNKALNASHLSIVNMTQLLSRLNADDDAELCKYNTTPSSADIEITAYASGFTKENVIEYELEKYLRHDSNGRDARVPWYIRVFFTVKKDGEYECSDIKGHIWSQNSAQPTESISFLESITPDYLVFSTGNPSTTKTIAVSIDPTTKKVNFGHLETGNYVFQFYLYIPNRGEGRNNSSITAMCYLSEVMFNAYVHVQKSGYYWKVGDKTYDGINALGVSISTDVTDNMIGDKFKWSAYGRMNTQDYLVPPKYRNTAGAQRFYNALNGTYIDPDTNKYYVFLNPYVEGAPSEYIYKNDKIKPTIEGITNASNELFGVIADIAYDADDNDVLKPDSEEGDKNDALKYEHSFFYIKLNIFNGEYGFDLFSRASQTDPMTIQMRDGSCNGCKFKIQAAKFTDANGLETYKNPIIVEDGKAVGVVSEEGISESDLDIEQQNTQTNSIWICVQKDAETFGVIMPNKSNDFKPKIGDKFNIINIDLPQGYILAAEKRLEQEGIRFMADNNEEKFTFDIAASRIFLADHPEILSELDEYSMIKVKYNGKIYEQYVNQLTIDCKDNEALPNIGIDLTDTLAVNQSFIDQVAERASSLIANAYTMGGALGSGSGNGLTTRLADMRYLKKIQADRSKGKVSTDVGFEVGEFVSGSSGGIFFRDPETGQTYLETDRLKVRMKAIFAELMIAKESSIGGLFDITPGGAIEVSFVEDVADTLDEDGNVVSAGCYRCYFKAAEDEAKAECRFAVGDQAICKDFALAAGAYTNTASHFYWRYVTAVNNEGSYIELSKYDCAEGSDAPQIGDTIVQLGNRDNAERRSAIVLSTVDAFAPCVTLYDGIGYPDEYDEEDYESGAEANTAFLAKCYSLENKSVVEYGVDKTKNPPEPFFNCYGRFFFGPRDKSSYLEFNPSDKSLVFKGVLDIRSTIGDKSLPDYIKENGGLNEDVKNFVNLAIQGVQDQIDGVIETWFGDGAPSLNRDEYPMNQWGDTTDDAHLGDLYYDNTTGYAYRFSKRENGTYFWNIITDDAITKALAAAQAAKDLADGKRRIFVSQPTPPYQEGDMWVNATYGTQYSNDILRCITNAKADGGTFSIADWTLASKYTDDSALNTFIAGYDSTIADIQGQVDKKAETWYQPTNPATQARPNGWLGEPASEHVGDLWYCTADIAGTDYKKGTTWYWGKNGWEKQDIPQSVFDTIDGKAEIFVSQPVDGYHAKDLWFLEKEYTLLDGKHEAGTLVVAISDMGASWSADDWMKKDRYTDDTLAQLAKEEAESFKYIKAALKGNTVINGGLVLSSLFKLGTWSQPANDDDKATMTKVYAGMNGIYANNRTIASWWGGDMVDRFNASNQLISPTPTNAATALVRMDGSAYFAGGNVGFNTDGSGWLAGNHIRWDEKGSITFGTGIKIDLGSGESSTLGDLNSAIKLMSASLGTITTFVNNFANHFRPIVKEGDDDVEKNWGEITTDTPVYAIKSLVNFFSEGWLSAKGTSDSVGGGGGSSWGLLKKWSDYKAELADTDALSAGLGWSLRNDQQSLAARIGSLEGGSALSVTTTGSGNAVTDVVKNGTSIAVTKGATFLTSHELSLALGSYYTKTQANGRYHSTNISSLLSGVDSTIVTFDKNDVLGRPDGTSWVNGFISTHNNYLSSIIVNNHRTNDWYVGWVQSGVENPSVKWVKLLHTDNYASVLDTAYVKKRGDTMTGDLTISKSAPLLKIIGREDGSTIQFNASDDTWRAYMKYIGNTSDGLEIASRYGYINLKSAGNLLCNGNTIWHSGNDGAGSGLDADLLDGCHETSFFRNSIGAIAEADILTTLPGNRSGSYVVTHGGWNGAATVFHNNSSNSGLALYRPGGSNSMPKILIALDSKSAWADMGTILTNLVGNAVSATKLANTRTIWGQNFDGSANVIGDLFNVGKIYMSGDLHMTNNASGKGFYATITSDGDLRFCTHKGWTWQTNTVAFSYDGRVGVGMMVPAYPLDVNGTVRATVLRSAAVEIYAPIPYIDFHFGSSDADYTSRIIENASGELAVTGKLKIGTGTNSYALNAASFICDSWVRTKGATGWYNETYGGGWYMEDSTWIRSYGSKNIYQNAGILRTDGTFQVGVDGTTFIAKTGGNVGVKNTNPERSLDVLGNERLASSISGAGGDVFLELWRGTNASWKLLNSGGVLHLQSNYTSAVTSYFDCLTMDYNTGNTYLKGKLGIGKKAEYDLDISGSARVGTEITTFRLYGGSQSFYLGDWENNYYIIATSDMATEAYVNNGSAGWYIGLDGNIETFGYLKIKSATISYDNNAVALKCTKGFYSDSYISAKGQSSASDMRLKRVLRNIGLTVKDIAAAPAIIYEWRDGSGIDLGSSAQYWERKVPESVKWYSGYRSLAYDKLGLVASIINSREIVHLRTRYDRWLGTHETRLQKLERENRELKQEVKRLNEKVKELEV